MKTRLSMHLDAQSHEQALEIVDAVQAFLRTTYNRGLASYDFNPPRVGGPARYAQYDDNDGDPS